MTGDEGPVDDAPATPASALWLRGELLEIATPPFPDHPPQVIREWADPVRWRDPTPIGHRFLVLLCAGGDGRPPASGFDDILGAFSEAGWTLRRWAPGDDGANSATARREDFEVRVHRGGGRGILTLTGWTPAVYTGRQWSEPPFTISTAGGVLCGDCHGWGICLDCGGRPYSGGTGGYGRCWCAGNNAGPGLCIECAGTGLLTPEEATSMRRHRGLPDTDSRDAESHASNTGAFAAVSERPCGCGEFRCFWHNTVSEAEGHLLSRFTGTCHGCGAQRDHAFSLPLPGDTSA
uniref:Uncharacterized protein n=1 Tax=Streptomyces sp. NBC_01401 TaxID=2903854 RepID=A0AAU3H6D4_9ACTN